MLGDEIARIAFDAIDGVLRLALPNQIYGGITDGIEFRDEGSDGTFHVAAGYQRYAEASAGL